jgi:hypothetical protein
MLVANFQGWPFALSCITETQRTEYLPFQGVKKDTWYRKLNRALATYHQRRLRG